MTSPAFDLGIQGVQGFARWGSVLSQRKIARDPLQGVVDGTNTAFFTNYYPILTSGSLTVYDGATPVAGTADYDSGQITLSASPTNPPTATYTFTPYTATQVLQFLILGFDEMELRWPRSWKLVDSAGNAASESSANILVADAGGNEPDCGGSGFSVVRVQVAFLMLCTEYRYLLSQLGEASISNFMWRETVRGMMVDKTKISSNIKLALDLLEGRLSQGLRSAQEQFYPGNDQLGAYVGSPVTIDYAGNFEWQTDSKLFDYRGQLGYQFSYRAFG